MLFRLSKINILVFLLIVFGLYQIMNAEPCACGNDSTQTNSVASCCSEAQKPAATQSSCGCGSPSGTVKQMNQAKEASNPDMDCGIWSLSYIAKSLGVKKDEKAIKELMQYNPAKGATMQELAQAAQKLGLEAKGYQMSYAELVKRQIYQSKLGERSLAGYIVYLPNHFTVLTAIDTAKHILQFADSGKENLQLSEMKFRDVWEGYVLEIKKPEVRR